MCEDIKDDRLTFIIQGPSKAGQESWIAYKELLCGGQSKYNNENKCHTRVARNVHQEYK